MDHVMLVVHADVPPDEDEWARMTVVRDANRAKIRGVVVVAPARASLNAAQRADVAQFVRASGASVAVVTDSALMRGVARAVGFLGVQVRAFSPTEQSEALRFSLVPQARHADMLRRLDAMRAQLAASASLRPPL
ncbi:MAG TPA: hypothetical protein VER04_05045 [Polyangiaceae bacterium]|nr:hypothetical protein [Polyangiaceae bacterium]